VRLFDAHCDTILKIVDEGHRIFDGRATAHVTLPGLRRAGVAAQLFACFVLRKRHPGTEEQRAMELIDAIHAMVDESHGAFHLVDRAEVLALDDGASGAIAVLIGLEGADPLVGRVDALHRFFARGVRLLTLAWSDNEFAGTAFGTDTGLTQRGVDLVALAEELGVLVDVSHLSDRAFEDVANAARRPFVASHSNCRSLCPSLRNLTDRQIRTLADRGGALGVNLFPGFLDPQFRAAMEAARTELCERHGEGWEAVFDAHLRTMPRPPATWIARHVLHAIRVGGEDCVGLGADLDGVSSLPDGIDGAGDLAELPNHLAAAGLRTRQVEKVCWETMHRLFSEALPSP
jgi:membrane dipeptidase